MLFSHRLCECGLKWIVTADDLSGLLLTEVRYTFVFWKAKTEHDSHMLVIRLNSQSWRGGWEKERKNGSAILFLDLQHFGETTKKEKNRCKSSAVTIHFKEDIRPLATMVLAPADSSVSLPASPAPRGQKPTNRPGAPFYFPSFLLPFFSPYKKNAARFWAIQIVVAQNFAHIPNQKFIYSCRNKIFRFWINLL